MLSAVESVERDLARLPKELSESGLAASMLSLAVGLDDARASLAMKAMAAKEIRETLDRLRELAPPARKEDSVDGIRNDLAKQRAKRDRGAAAQA
jgi:hypothetical protein